MADRFWVKIIFITSALLAIIGGALVAGLLYGVAGMVFIVDTRVYLWLWLIATLTIATIFLYMLTAYAFDNIRRQAVGAVERVRRDDLDNNNDIGNDGQADEFGWLHTEAGSTRISGIHQNNLNKMVMTVFQQERFPEAMFLGSGKMFLPGERATFEKVRAQLVDAGLIEKLGSGSSPFKRTADGERLASYHLRRAYDTPLPHRETLENAA